MFDLILLAIAVAAGGGEGGRAEGALSSADLPSSTSPTVTTETTILAPTSTTGGLAPPPGAGTATATAQSAPAPLKTLEAEPQVATGKFTTALEVKPILDLTRANWVAVREWDGKDLVYVTHLFSWRCGLLEMRFSVNGAPLEDWPLPDCHLNTNSPNALRADDGLPYKEFPLGSVKTISVEITLDDLTSMSHEFERLSVLMP